MSDGRDMEGQAGRPSKRDRRCAAMGYGICWEGGPGRMAKWYAGEPGLVNEMGMRKGDFQRVADLESGRALR